MSYLISDKYRKETKTKKEKKSVREKCFMDTRRSISQYPADAFANATQEKCWTYVLKGLQLHVWCNPVMYTDINEPWACNLRQVVISRQKILFDYITLF